MSDTIPAGRIDLLLEKLNRERISDKTRMQCKVCWYVYEPEEGCDEMGVPPETPFNDLPETFTCPGCGNGKSAFLPCADEEN